VRQRDTEEHKVFRDSGCRFYSACLSCPFAVCKLDDAAAVNEHRAERAEILAGYRAGFSPQELARIHHKALRSIYRDLKLAREAEAK
jgi:hypothetical protein